MDRKKNPQDTDLASFDSAAFEQLVSNILKDRGFEVTEVGGRGRDAGIDLSCRPARSSQEWIVQVKRFRRTLTDSYSTRALINELIASRVLLGAAKVLLVVSSKIDPSARALIKSHPDLEVWDASDVLVAIRANHQLLPSNEDWHFW